MPEGGWGRPESPQKRERIAAFDLNISEKE